MSLLDTMREFNAMKEMHISDALRAAHPAQVTQLDEVLSVIENMLTDLPIDMEDIGRGVLVTTAATLKQLERAGELTQDNADLLSMVIPTLWVDGLLVGLCHAQRQDP